MASPGMGMGMPTQSPPDLSRMMYSAHWIGRGR